MTSLSLQSKARNELIDITARIRQIVRQAGIRSGVALVFVPHTTAACTINEHADPDVAHDILLQLDRLAPRDSPGFRHAEGNSDAHIKACLLGSSVAVPVEEGDLVLGTWQGVFFAEFDGPRLRTIHVQIVGSP